MTVPKAINPYAKARKPASHHQSIGASKPGISSGATVDKKKHVDASTAANVQRPAAAPVAAISASKVVLKTSAALQITTKAVPSVKMAPLAASLMKPASLKAKLRKDIENLKRAKLLQKQRIQDVQRRKVLEKQKRKQEAELRKTMVELQAKQPVTLNKENSRQPKVVVPQQRPPVVPDGLPPPVYHAGTTAASLFTNPPPFHPSPSGAGQFVPPHVAAWNQNQRAAMFPTPVQQQATPVFAGQHYVTPSPVVAKQLAYATTVAMTMTTTPATTYQTTLASLKRMQNVSVQNVVEHPTASPPAHTTTTPQQQTPPIVTEDVATAPVTGRLLPDSLAATMEQDFGVSNPSQSPSESKEASHLSAVAGQCKLQSELTNRSPLDAVLAKTAPAPRTNPLTAVSATTVASKALPDGIPYGQMMVSQQQHQQHQQQAMYSTTAPALGMPQSAAPVGQPMYRTMNYGGGYYPYQNAYPGIIPPQLQHAWCMQQQQLQHQQLQQSGYPPLSSGFYQPPLLYNGGLMPAAVTSSRPVASRVISSRPVASRPTTPKSLQGPARLADAMQPPSPYSQTHELLQFAITIVKKPGESFGVTVKTEMESALVEPEWLELQQPSVIAGGGGVGSSIRKETPAVVMPNQPDSVTAKTTDAKVGAEETKVTSVAVPSEGDKKQIERPSGVPGDAKSPDLQENKAQNPRRARRRRVFFSAMVVVDPTKQNQRGSTVDPSKQLVKGDILLIINGTKTAGHTFKEACALFAGCNTVADDGLVHCTVTVARRKWKPVYAGAGAPSVPPTVPTALPASGKPAPQFLCGPLTVPEIASFNGSVLKAIFDSRRLLGRPVSDNLLRSLTLEQPALSPRTFSTLKDAWSSVSLIFESIMAERAIQNWKTQWKNEKTEVQLPEREFLSDGQRSTMRAAPRPPKGCKCGKIDHEYVNDHRCPLYSDIVAGEPDSAELMTVGPKLIQSKLQHDLNVVAAAFKERFVRQQEEREAHELEARFVARMEAAQLTKHSKAVFAPGLTALVLSAVVELQAAFKHEKETPVPAVVEKEPPLPPKVSVYDSSDDSDDEDVPLAALKKRALGDSNDTSNKKQKTEHAVRRKFLAMLLQSISKKWGHVYSEPSDMEYAW